MSRGVHTNQPVTDLGRLAYRCEGHKVCHQLWLPRFLWGLRAPNRPDRKGWGQGASVHILHCFKREACERAPGDSIWSRTAYQSPTGRHGEQQSWRRRYCSGGTVTHAFHLSLPSILIFSHLANVGIVSMTQQRFLKAVHLCKCRVPWSSRERRIWTRVWRPSAVGLKCSASWRTTMGPVTFPTFVLLPSSLPLHLPKCRSMPWTASGSLYQTGACRAVCREGSSVSHFC